MTKCGYLMGKCDTLVAELTYHFRKFVTVLGNSVPTWGNVLPISGNVVHIFGKCDSADDHFFSVTIHIRKGKKGDYPGGPN